MKTGAGMSGGPCRIARVGPPAADFEIGDEDARVPALAGRDQHAACADVVGVALIGEMRLAVGEADLEAVGVSLRLALEIAVRAVGEPRSAGQVRADRGEDRHGGLDPCKALGAVRVHQDVMDQHGISPRSGWRGNR
jgi:hypothetical protein